MDETTADISAVSALDHLKMLSVQGNHYVLGVLCVTVPGAVIAAVHEVLASRGQEGRRAR